MAKGKSGMEAKPIMKSVDELKREVTFLIYEPGIPDAHSEWMSKKSISKACESFNECYFEKKIAVQSLFHMRDEDGNIEATDSFEIMTGDLIFCSINPCLLAVS